MHLLPRKTVRLGNVIRNKLIACPFQQFLAYTVVLQYTLPASVIQPELSSTNLNDATL